MIRRTVTLCLLAAGAAPAAAAQSAAGSPASSTPPAVRRAAATITETDVRRRIFLIADDSMGGRNTPSQGLDKTASYIASEFRRFGLRPGGDSGGYLLRYPILTRRLIAAASTARFGAASGEAGFSSSLAEGAALWYGATDAAARGSVVLAGGKLTPDSLRAEDFKDRIAVYLPDAGGVSGEVLRQMISLGARAVAVVSSDSVVGLFQRRQGSPRTAVGAEVALGGAGPIILAIKESAVLAQVPAAAEQFAMLRNAAGPAVHPVDDWEGEIALKDTTLSASYAPDVVGILEGSDPVLKNEYLVFSAHMDHVGTGTGNGNQCFQATPADSICNGADDDGSGTVGVVELAEAFASPGARPRRSVIFLTVSGEEHGLWGSDWFTAHPPVPLPQIVADLNADMIGRNWKDTIVAIGKEHSDLGATLNRVNAAHPELTMHAIDDRWPEEHFYERSDHYNFARRGVPILFFFNGVHPDYHAASDSPDKIDAEKEARIVRLLFYLGQEVANARERPKWVPASYRQIVTPERP